MDFFFHCSSAQETLTFSDLQACLSAVGLDSAFLRPQPHPASAQELSGVRTAGEGVHKSRGSPETPAMERRLVNQSSGRVPP